MPVIRGGPRATADERRRLKLLLDQNLSHRLVRLLADTDWEIAHVRDFGLARADDTTVWAFAAGNNDGIVSKDSDFHQRSLVFGHPPKVVWLRLGNCSTSEIEAVLRASQPMLAAFHQDPESSLLTVDRSHE